MQDTISQNARPRTARPYSSRLYNRHIGSRLFSSRSTSRNIPSGHYITKYDYVDRYRVLNWHIEQMGLDIADEEAAQMEEQRPKTAEEKRIIRRREISNDSGGHTSTDNPGDCYPFAVAHVEACKQGDIEKVVDYLESTGADINAKDVYGNSALHWAIINDNMSMVSVLLSQPCIDVGLRAKSGATPLHLAAERGNIEIFDALRAQGANVSDLNEQTRRTLLHHAAWNGQTAMCKKLLEAGLDIHAKDWEDQNCLQLAVKFEYDKTAEYLQSMGASM